MNFFGWGPVAPFIKEFNPRLAKRPLTSLVKDATGDKPAISWIIGTVIQIYKFCKYGTIEHRGQKYQRHFWVRNGPFING